MRYFFLAAFFLIAPVVLGKHVPLRGFEEKPKYQISTVAGQPGQEIQLTAKLTPIPARESLVLTVAAAALEKKMTYSLSDLEGRILIQDRLVKTSTIIDVSALNTGTYFIKIHSGNRQLKTFKVLKVR